MSGHEFRTFFNDQEWASILNHALTVGGPMSISTTVHQFVNAAPVLLEALKELEDAASVTSDSRVDAARRAARDAIAMATGRQS